MDNKTMSLIGRLSRVAGKLDGLSFGVKDDAVVEAMFAAVEEIDGIIREVQQE